MNEAIGWALFHFLWEGAAIALLLAILLVVFRGSRARYAAACAALLAMLAAFGVTLAIKLPANPTAVAIHIPAGKLPPRPADSPALGVPIINPAMPYSWAVPLWLAGVALLSLHRLAGFAGAYRLRRAGVCLAPAPWPDRLRELASQLGVGGAVQLLESCLTEVPVTAGYLRPAILLPVGMLAGLPTEQVEYILIHELAHIARRDYLVNVLQSLVEALLFYHPAVWWVSGVIRAEREHCCDDAVVALAGDARGYAAALVKLEQGRALEPALAATGGSLSNRVRRLLQSPAPQSVVAPLAAAAVALAMVGVALAATAPAQIPLPSVILPHPAAPVLVAPTPTPAEIPLRLFARPAVLVAQQQVPPATTAPQDPQTRRTAKASLETPYRKWLNEDVAYIITDEERAAFKSLSTDPELENFIQQFWLRRDPTPGTVENEFKEEHYRRIAYANDHFSTSIAGWKTDRGRVYITYGPPDEIDDHSAGGTYQRPAAEGGGSTTTYPFQQWRYKFIEGVGKDVIVEFIDPTMTNEFRMTSDPQEKDALQYIPGAAPKAQAQATNLQQFRKLNVPPATAAAGPTNVYVANEPGGRVSVHVTGKVATASLPFATPGNYSITGRVTLPGGRMAAAVEDRARYSAAGPATLPGSNSQSQWNSVFTLSPGTSYLLTLTYKNTDTGETHMETVNFYVY